MGRHPRDDPATAAAARPAQAWSIRPHQDQTAETF